MGLNRYKYLVRTYATLYYLGADRVPGAARHTGWCARAAPLSPGSVTAGSWHSVAGHLAVLPIAHVGYLRAATQVPKDIPAGDYVVGFRWDCEESAQIWSSCSDITITAA